MTEQNQTGDAQGLSQRIKFSVIIPAFNEEKVIAKCLTSLVQQDFPADAFEVIVVDNGSTDNTLEVARRFSASLRLTILQKANVNISGLRNRGVAAAKGQFLAFLDSDCLAHADWLSRAMELLFAGDGGVMGAFYTVPEDSSWVARAWYGDLPTLRVGQVSYVPSGTLFVSSRVYKQLGGFDETLATSEDFDFCQRAASAGFKVLSFPVLSTVHLGTPQTLSCFYRKQQWHGTGVRTAFQRNIFDRGFAKTALFTMYWLFWMVCIVAAVPLALAVRNFALILVAPAALLLSSAVLAARNAMQRKRWSLLVPMTLLYTAYGISRSMSFLGLGKKRSPQTLTPSTATSLGGSANVG